MENTILDVLRLHHFHFSPFATRVETSTLRSPELATSGDQRQLRHEARGIRKRFDYEDNYDWETDKKSLDYEVGDKEETLFQKMARNWKTVLLRFIFVFSFLIMVLFCCRCCCRLICPFICDACTTNCDQCMEWFALYVCGKDPAFKKFNKFAKAFGIDIDYETFQKIKGNYGFEGNLMDSSAQQKAAENFN
ncbi:uncharacterized protein [Haliotis cracherodii]|uniref:uncharacterized protein n=1 Tax=Haliotis cracherodii TaxID=6455 RepID=UPI0039E9896B